MTPTDTRERILEVAARLFHEQGYNATGIATILRESGVNSGSLYHFFAGKEALLLGVLERYVEMLEPMVLQSAEARTDDPLEKIFALLDWYREGMLKSGCTMGCPVGNLALELSDNHPEVRRLLDLNFRNWAAGIRGWLEEAGERLPDDVDLEQLSHFILTVMEGAIMQSRARGSLDPYDASVAQLRLYFKTLEDSARARW